MIHLTSRDELFLPGRNEGGYTSWIRDSGSDPEHDLSLMF
jgi:hypothetical protein